MIADDARGRSRPSLGSVAVAGASSPGCSHRAPLARREVPCGMNRRATGLALLVGAIIAVLLVPVVSGRRVAGVAQRAPTPDPPKIGDCLQDVPSKPSSMDFTAPLFAATTTPCGP